MKKNRSIFSYFSNGFKLANKSLVIYLIAYLFVISVTVTSYAITNHLSNTILTAFFQIVMIFFSCGFSLSIPLFLLQKQQGKALNSSEMFSTTLENTKRASWPIILLLVLVVLALIVTIVFFTLYLYPNQHQMTLFLQSLSNQRAWYPIIVISEMIFALFVFTSVLFSIEHKGLLTAIKGSVSLAIKHLDYLGLIVASSLVSYSIFSLIPHTQLWGVLLRDGISVYISLVIKASTLGYYQQVIKRQE